MSKPDFVLWVAAFLGSLFVGIDVGLVLGIAAGLLGLFWRAATSRLQVLRELPGCLEHRDRDEIAQYLGKPQGQSFALPQYFLFRMKGSKKRSIVHADLR